MLNPRPHDVTSVSTDAGLDTKRSWRLPATLLVIFACFWAALAVAPLSRSDWLLENLLVFASLPVLVATRQRMPFSNASYVCLFIFLMLHAIGAHYTYALVPYDRWWEALTGGTFNELMGWDRNHYDRLVHFLYGVLILPPSVELVERYGPMRSGWSWAMPLLFVISHSAIYETVEWIAALIVAPELGNAYLGTQGDEWDAQKDMALANGGAILSMAVVGLLRARARRR